MASYLEKFSFICDEIWIDVGSFGVDDAQSHFIMASLYSRERTSILGRGGDGWGSGAQLECQLVFRHLKTTFFQTWYDGSAELYILIAV